ncbi:hypothetical protein RJ639_000610 [Escallonia herrerae]|uniref:peroxidase n=1 Tax=Escallonia herrerae TaxID=1293975 RepID=A0AA88XBY0_9ASTE|nr:hypothetical protein RJ639_000610 [Escallonia herrerae]
MASSVASFNSKFYLVISSLLLVTSHFCVTVAQKLCANSGGTLRSFYDSSCPNLESVIRKQLQKVFKNDIGQAAGLLRLHFHDCFVQGCEGSVLLDGSSSEPSEKDARPNLTLRPEAFKIIDDLRRRVHKQCGRVVSCSDITTLTARDAVFLSGGPDYDVPLGRRDNLDFAWRNVTLANVPAPTSTTNALLTSLATKNLDATDVVALSGGHTIGIGLQGVFTSDEDLYTVRRTRGIVTSFAVNQTLFFEKFVDAMMKMGQLNVLTGTQGEIRANSNDAFLASNVDESEEKWSQFEGGFGCPKTKGGSVFTLCILCSRNSSRRSSRRILAKLLACFASIFMTALFSFNCVLVRCKGCDGSVLLDGSHSGPSEKDAPPNLTLRTRAFKIIDDLRRRVHEECGRVVSCADIVALAARDAVFLSGGPDYDVPLGRKDGLNFATRDATLANLPSPTSNASAILASLATKNLDATDVVALSGGHTIGIGHCSSFTPRLYPSQDPTMDKTFANDLKHICSPPPPDSNNTTLLDIRTPNTFDNKYYVDLMNRQGLFTSDQDLYTDAKTRDIVESFAIDQTLFFDKFVHAMIKMGQLSVLTGGHGEIRCNCSVRNSDNKSFLTYMAEDDEESRSELR